MSDSIAPLSAPRVALIGFGEAGETFARAGDWHGHARGCDLLREREALMPACGVETGPSELVFGDADIILSLVTADQAGYAAEKYCHYLAPGALWCDMNSVSPDTKRDAAYFVEFAGTAYVDVAIMAPVNPAGLAVPLLLSGAEAARAAQLLSALGFSNIRVVGHEVGRASAIKMIRSVMVKGLEALSWECAAAAEAAGIFDEVTASLDASEKPLKWAERIAYNRERMETHGLRRAAEMEESARTLQGLGIDPVMTRSTAELQRKAATKNERTQAA
jgi:3-hydroxyisobutyrate dehydrogenase-like beta-hydroxyacid dehydrogenase